MTHQTGSGFLIIDGDMIPVQELFHKAQDLAEYRRLQGTVLIGDHPVGTAGKESAPDTGFGLGQGILGLIAVAVHSRGGQQRMLLQFNAADPAHIFIDNAVLQPAFLAHTGCGAGCIRRTSCRPGSLVRSAWERG